MIELTKGTLSDYYAALFDTAAEPPLVDPRDFRLQQVLMSEDALTRLPELILSLGGATRVLLVQDDIAYYRQGELVKPLVKELLTTAGYMVEVVELAGEVHAEPARIDTVVAALRPTDLVVALGGGVIADITKAAVHAFEQTHTEVNDPFPEPGVERVKVKSPNLTAQSSAAHTFYQTQSALRLVVIQSANSVCAYASGMAVITMAGVKRTLPSRLPDALVLDGKLLADAPSEYSAGGIGDASVAAVSFADYRLGYLMGLTKWEPRAWEVMEFSRQRFLSKNPLLADRTGLGMGVTAMDLTACGLAMTVAGESAPLSGLEHVTSHTLDMAAAHHSRPIGNHGSQCALATILSLIAWDKLLEGADISGLDPAKIDADIEQAKVRAAFGQIDAEGKAWQECWSDYQIKIKAWQDNRDSIRAFVANWATMRQELRGYAAKPAEYVAALAATGHRLKWEEIPTGITEAQARWAFTNARLMRKRTSVADLFGFAGQWNEDFIAEVFDIYHQIIKEYL